MAIQERLSKGRVNMNAALRPQRCSLTLISGDSVQRCICTSLAQGQSTDLVYHSAAFSPLSHFKLSLHNTLLVPDAVRTHPSWAPDAPQPQAKHESNQDRSNYDQRHKCADDAANGWSDTTLPCNALACAGPRISTDIAPVSLIANRKSAHSPLKILPCQVKGGNAKQWILLRRAEIVRRAVLEVEAYIQLGNRREGRWRGCSVEFKDHGRGILWQPHKLSASPG